MKNDMNSDMDSDEHKKIKSKLLFSDESPLSYVHEGKAIDSGLTIETKVYAVDAREISDETDYKLIIGQGVKDSQLHLVPNYSGPQKIAVSIDQLKRMLEGCTGTVIGAKTGDAITYSHQREQLIHYIKDKKEELEVASTTEHGAAITIASGVEIDDEGNIGIKDDLIELVRYMAIYCSLEIIEREVEEENEGKGECNEEN